eukprot:TRINITY_DN32467_c0_g1_i1.p1 TRINITY_DN32467_c0_g1~~TRINITY_DN32467_c0_g1_i1.p1  ORF type:complete len:282 (-),score=109.01 TRINITY_DN32467_c0_g1_i1:114-959(-)
MRESLGLVEQAEKAAAACAAAAASEDEAEKGGDEAKAEKGGDESKAEDANDSVHDPYYPPIIYLPEIEVNSGEDDEEEIVRIRAKLYRYAHECEPPEWKERGTGDIRILKNPELHTCRVVMRREKTLKVCANHFILPWMELKKNCNSDKAWLWKTQADYADDTVVHQTLAARFSNVANATKWKNAFDEAAKYVLEKSAEAILSSQGEDISSFNKENAAPNKDENATKGKENATLKEEKCAGNKENAAPTSPKVVSSSPKKEGAAADENISNDMGKLSVESK